MRRCLGFGSRAKRFFLPSPAKERPLTWNNPVGRFDLYALDFDGEELFFDSKACLDSDCEDDFFSVNGDSTPSRGNTPDHRANVQSNPVLDGAVFIDKHLDTKSEPSPTGSKKLSDLLQETSRGERVVDAPTAAETKKTMLDGMAKVEKDRSRGLPNGNQYLSSNSADEGGATTPSRDRRKKKKKKGKTWKDGHCCLPSLHSFGFDEKRDKMNAGACNAE